MSNNGADNNSYENNAYTDRQIRSSFQSNQQTMMSQAQQQPQQFYPQIQPSQFSQQQQQYYFERTPQPPQSTYMSGNPSYYAYSPPELLQQPYQQNNNYRDQSYQSDPTTMVNPQQTTATPMRHDAPLFVPVSNNTTKTTDVQPTFSINPSDTESAASTNSFIYDLNKYKYDSFLSKLSGNFDQHYARFGSPTGICTLDNDRLLVANFDRDSLVLIDINGVVYQIYKDLPTPKDVRCHSTNPAQVIVATKKEVVILDLTTSKVVKRSKLRGFYPWNIQYMEKHDTIAACDPSGERIVFLDKDLENIGSWSFNEAQSSEKVYPYASYYLNDNAIFAVTHRRNTLQLLEKNGDGKTIATWNTPANLLSYSIYVDGARKCLIPDKVNHRLVSIENNSTPVFKTYKSVYEPYSITFLSTGTLCITDWNKSFGTNGGIAILSEVDLKNNP